MLSMPLHFIGLGFEAGQPKPGLRASPNAFREHFPLLRAAGFEVTDHGDFVTPFSTKPVSVGSEDELGKYPMEIYQNVYSYLSGLGGELRLNWGGDHSIALCTVGAFLHAHPSGKVVWIDAHADMNLPELSPTGNFHGMPLAILLNLGGIGKRCFPWIANFLKPENLLLVGCRDLDPFERATIRQLGLKVIPGRALKTAPLTREIREWAGDDPVHVSFDIDSVDPKDAPSTGVPVRRGFSRSEILNLGRILKIACRLSSIDIVEINPWLGTPEEAELTIRLALQFFLQLTMASLEPNLTLESHLGGIEPAVERHGIQGI